MTQMTITGQSTIWTLNVISYQSPIYGQINSAQTKTMAVHFPIKMAQPDLQVTVQFKTQGEFQGFQQFVRNNQQQISMNPAALLTFNFPARAMYNWSGFIPELQAGGARANYAPVARFNVVLVNSYVTQQTDLASTANAWQSIFGGLGGSGGVLTAGNLIAQPVQSAINIATQINSTVGILSGTR